MKRREFVGLAVAGVAVPMFRPDAAHADVAGLKTRKVPKVEIAYKSPHAKPNGLLRGATISCPTIHPLPEVR